MKKYMLSILYTVSLIVIYFISYSKFNYEIEYISLYVILFILGIMGILYYGHMINVEFLQKIKEDRRLFYQGKIIHKAYCLMNKSYIEKKYKCEDCGWIGSCNELFYRSESNGEYYCDQHECPVCTNVIINNLD